MCTQKGAKSVFQGAKCDCIKKPLNGDVVLTKLLTIEEYAASTTEPILEVRKRIETAGILVEFLDYIKLSGQYHIAREYQVYSLFVEMLPLLKKMEGPDQKQLKRIAFNNILLL